MAEPKNYYEKVYAGVLGKVIGVYLGKPFEGWTNELIERKLGEIWYYVHQKLGRPIVQADDDISGTFTFLRAMEDHDTWSDVTSKQIGDSWLNYLIEYQTVLWWGGMGVSTEHTAWLRLASGIPAPQSGSMELNGPLVAEQIGAQIFIDGWGMVAPGDPELAARLAAQAGRVSHDGEAVFAAQAVAAMEAAAFEESDMDKLLDVAMSVIPADSLTAQIHRDVREWAGGNGDDWRATFRSIQTKYGYDKYRGGCHVVPNHAVMVMAWAHAPDDFQKALMIANTAGWDTDCNSANVGCLMGIRGGLAGIAAGPDWQGPFADRVLIPTAEGTRSITDCLVLADVVADYGRRVMDWPAVERPKGGAQMHFSLPGSLHGFLPQRDLPDEGSVRVTNSTGRLRVEFAGVAPGKPARVVTPTYLLPEQLAAGGHGSYNLAATPTIYSGQTLRAKLSADAGNRESVSVQLFVRYYERDDSASGGHHGQFTGEALSDLALLSPGNSADLEWTVPDTDGWPIALLGLQVDGPGGSSGVVEMDSLGWEGPPKIDFGGCLPSADSQSDLLGWIRNCKLLHRRSWNPAATLQHNSGLGVISTGNRDWTDYALEGKVSLRLADAAGLAVRYQGLRRYVALLYSPPAGKLELIQQVDDEQCVLGSVGADWSLNEEHAIRVEVRDQHVVALVDGKKVLEAEFEDLERGGVACLSDRGTASFSELAVEPL